ncbi:hypothetical protein FB451DRAFT_1212875 [Mycena latifolia]|nr:hypothetical protein FB451DRAFT_1212875 [Mycena latifolia]
MAGFGPTNTTQGVRSAELFLESRMTRRATRKRMNAEKQVRNTSRASQRTGGAIARDTIGDDERLEDDSDDEFEVSDPVAQVAGTTTTPPTDAQAVLAIMQNLGPQQQTLFLSIMAGLQSGTSTNPASAPAPTPVTPIDTAPIPSIFNPALLRPATSIGNSRFPFSARLLELATAGIYLELSLFTNETIHDMFVNQNVPKYQPQKRIIIGENGNPVKIHAIDPSIFEDQTALSHTRFNEAHANYRRWYVQNAPPGVSAQLEAYDNHRHHCSSVILHDEEDFMMIKIWCKDWMQRATWNPTIWDEEVYQRDFEASRARYFENKVARQIERVQAATEAAGDDEEADHADEYTRRESTPPTDHEGPDRGRLNSSARYSPYAREGR